MESKQIPRQDNAAPQQKQLSAAGAQREGGAVWNAARLLQAEVSLWELSPQELEQVAGLIGNQRLLALLEHGGEPVATAPPLPPAGGETPPEHGIQIRWPALFPAPPLIRRGSLLQGATPVDGIRPFKGGA